MTQDFGRIQDEHPIFINKESGHILITHGGVTLIMARIRPKYWSFPSLQQLVKKTIMKCFGCKRFHVIITYNCQRDSCR